VIDDAPPPSSRPLFHRLGLRDGAPIDFTIDGRPARAMTGDLLITAILTNRSDLRRFEFAEATRAGFCLMGGCQDCWVDLADGRRVRACSTPVEPGMAVIVEGGRR
jgi:predicted molibdopterin-dependent oxidoreductase YjgC